MRVYGWEGAYWRSREGLEGRGEWWGGGGGGDGGGVA